MNIPVMMASVIQAVQPFYDTLDAWHNMTHARRVVALAKRINASEHGDPLLVEAGAWLHQYHDHLDTLRSVLKGLPFSKQQCAQLFGIVAQCRPHKISSQASLEARIVFDADALELVGPSGILREVLCNCLARNRQPDEPVQAAKTVQTLFVGKLQTQAAIQLAQSGNHAADLFWKTFKQWEAALSETA